MVSTTGIVRHPPPQSEWNLENLFTGRHDVALTKKGAARAGAAGVVRAEARIRFDTSHTPLQTHAVVDRALLEHLGNVSDDAISDIDIATGASRAYSLHERLVVTNASYLGDAEAVAAAAAAAAAQAGTA